MATYTKNGEDITVEYDRGLFTLRSPQRGETWPDLMHDQAVEVLGDQWGVSFRDRINLLDGFDVR